MNRTSQVFNLSNISESRYHSERVRKYFISSVLNSTIKKKYFFIKTIIFF